MIAKAVYYVLHKSSIWAIFTYTYYLAKAITQLFTEWHSFPTSIKKKRMNLAQQLQDYLKFPALEIIDPNTGLPVNEANYDAVSQATLITFLAGLYKSTRTKEGAAEIKAQTNAEQLISVIFQDVNYAEGIIAEFAAKPIAAAKQKLIEVSRGWLSFIQLQVPAEQTQKEDHLQNLMTAERNEILKYVPGKLKLGDLLNDEAMDDNTNKMQGPISSLMHKIENAFSTSN